MYFPASRPDALDVVRHYSGGSVVRFQVEAALDVYIMVEPDGLGRGGAEQARFTRELTNALRILRTYGEQVRPATLENLQDEFYSFSNSNKYRYSVETISVVRTMLSTAWNGIAGWRD